MKRPPEIPELPWNYLEPLDGIKTMLELGNKKDRTRRAYKFAFEEMGIRHTSVDWNGEDGALKLDLRKPLNLSTFDMVTNFGTSEHVSEQTPVWRNMIEAVKLGGILISHTPQSGWKRHGIWYPKTKFYLDLAALNGFVFDRGPEIIPMRNLVNTLCCVRMRRIMECAFQMPDLGLIKLNS